MCEGRSCGISSKTSYFCFYNSALAMFHSRVAAIVSRCVCVVVEVRVAANIELMCFNGPDCRISVSRCDITCSGGTGACCYEDIVR